MHGSEFLPKLYKLRDTLLGVVYKITVGILSGHPTIKDLKVIIV